MIREYTINPLPSHFKKMNAFFKSPKKTKNNQKKTKSWSPPTKLLKSMAFFEWTNYLKPFFYLLPFVYGWMYMWEYYYNQQSYFWYIRFFVFFFFGWIGLKCFQDTKKYTFKRTWHVSSLYRLLIYVAEKQWHSKFQTIS